MIIHIYDGDNPPDRSSVFGPPLLFKVGNVDIPSPVDNPTLEPVTPMDIGLAALVKPSINPTEYLPIAADPVRSKPVIVLSDFM